jgi:DNA-binding CsgD family transcriptional regulator
MRKRRNLDDRNLGLVGRAQETAFLAKVIRGITAKHGATVLVSGEAGVGKTALLNAVLADADLVVLRASANPLDGTPFATIVALLQALRRRAKGPAADRAATALQLLVATPGDMKTSVSRAELIDKICGVFVSVNQTQPLAIMIDDAQWADHATLELLPSLSEIARDAPLLIALACRDNEISRSHPLWVTCETIRRTGQLESLALGPLSDLEASSLIQSLLGADSQSELVKTILDRSFGNPLFMESLVTILKQQDGLTTPATVASLPLPNTIRDAVLMRIDSLSPQARSAIEVAAVGGSETDIELLTTVNDGDSGIEELVRSNLLIERDNKFAGFPTPLTQEAIYAAIPWTRRRAIHRRYAEALTSQGGEAARLAEHWRKAGEIDRARMALLVGAARARQLHAHRDASQFLSRALEIWPEGTDEPDRLTTLDQLGECAQLAGLLSQASQAWRELAETAASSQRFAIAGRASRKIANLHELSCDWRRALGSRQQAMALFIAGNEPAEAALEGITLAIRLRMSARYGAALEVLARAHTDAMTANRNDLTIRIDALKGNLEARTGLVEKGIASIQIALEKALELQNSGLAGEVYQRLADAIERSSKHKVAASVGQAGIAYCDNHGVAGAAVGCLTCLGWILVRCGDWDHAISASRRILDSPNCVPPARAGALLFTGLIKLFRGEIREGEGLLLEAEAVARRVDHVLGIVHSSWGLAVYAALTGDFESAAQRCRIILGRFRSIDMDQSFIPVLRWGATCFARVGDKDGLQACAETLSRCATIFSNPESISALSHALGEIAWFEGNAEQAADHFERAINLIEDWDLPRERIESQLRAAAAWAAIDRNLESAEFARAAVRGAERLGARPLSSAAAFQLRNLGESLDGTRGSQTARRAAQGGLTARQLEILASISRGLTDKEIARALRLSPRTVEMHVAHALATLDCRNRAEAVRKATESGVIGRL